MPVLKRRDHAFSDHLFEMASVNKCGIRRLSSSKRGRFTAIMYSRWCELCR